MRFFLLSIWTAAMVWSFSPALATAEEAEAVNSSGSSEGQLDEPEGEEAAEPAGAEEAPSAGPLGLWMDSAEIGEAVRRGGQPDDDESAEPIEPEGSEADQPDEAEPDEAESEPEEEAEPAWEPSTLIAGSHQLSIRGDGTVVPYLTLFLSRGLTPTVSVTAFSLANAGWAETYVGLSIRPWSWFSFGLSAGIEAGDGLWRVAASLGIAHEWFSLNWTFEYGASGRWHLLTVDFRISDGLSIGLMSKRFDGEGVYLAVRAGRFLVRLAGLYNGERAIDEIGEGVPWNDARFFTVQLTLGFNLSDSDEPTDDEDERAPASTGTLHVFVSASGDGVAPNLGLWLTRPLSDRFAFWYFGVAAPGYGEAYGGLNVTPWEWLTVGLAVGIETSESIWRLAASLDLVWGRLAISALFEIGGADWCQFVTLNYQVHDNLVIGVMSKRFDGEGAFLELRVRDLAFRAAFLYDIERARDEVGNGVEWTDPRFLTAFLWLHVDLW